ncbi:PRC and DUF2382 domain-containing protein [Kitasatospora sp. NPDC002040]|uniref:PRC and DUF2382 domain-containing protein n=1 Tax=Kitasatospora sp. NPDC002040 TaxID=3154661 RepID=UPI00332909FD
MSTGLSYLLEDSVQTDIDPRDLIGHKAVDRNGDKIGTVDEVYLDDATGEPEWAAVRTGIFGRDAFVPLTTSEFSGEELKVPYDKSLIKDSPDFGVGQHLSPAQELQLYRYYGLDAGGAAAPTAAAAAAAASNGSGSAKDLDFGTVGTLSKETSVNASPAPTMTAAPMAFTATTETPAAKQPESVGTAPPAHATVPTVPGNAPAGPVEITCREERLDVTTEWHVLGTAKLRKYVTTEAVERKVPVVKERVRVERVPVTEAERAALSEQEIAEAVEEVTLREERPVVRKYLAPIERVRLVVERYTEEAVIRDELRREQVEIHDATTAPEPPAAPAQAPSNTSQLRPEPLRPA